MSPSSNELHIYRRNLPHWRLRGASYFVTWRKHKNQDDLSPEEKDVVVAALRHFDGKRYELTGYVVMNDHAHVIVWPEDGHVLEDLCHTWKSFTAHEFQRQFERTGSVWQDESFDRIIRNEAEYHAKLLYVLNNPRKRWPEIRHYKWVWVKGM
jgi:REP element-mobilizing transposase RayT